MKIIKNILIILFFLNYPNHLLSVNFVKSDLSFLNFDDKLVFSEKCIEKERFIDTSQCLNFLGLKILLNNFDNLEFFEFIQCSYIVVKSNVDDIMRVICF